MEALLQFAPMQSSVDEGFWHRLSSLKLNKLGIDDSPIPLFGPFSLPFYESLYASILFSIIFSSAFGFVHLIECSDLILGFYAPCSHSQVSNHLTVLAESLPSDLSDAPLLPEPTRGNRNRCSVPGILYNTNTVESFHALDKHNLLKKEAAKVHH